MKFDANALTVDRKNRHGEKYLASWRHGRENEFSPLWQAASSAVRAANAFFSNLELLEADTHLSEQGRRAKVAERARSTMANIGAAQTLLNNARGELAQERGKLSGATRKGGIEGVAQQMLDMQIAQAVRALAPNERDALFRAMLGGESPEIAEAVMRSPSILSGVSNQYQAMLTRAAIARNHPREVALHESLDAALGTAQHVLRETLALVTTESPMDLSEQMQVLGNWKGLVDGPPEALEALSRRDVSQPAEADA